MGKTVLLLCCWLISQALFSQSSKYYYNRGLEWAESVNKIHWQTQAFKEWRTGEQKGEVDCARALIICYLEEKGTPRNVNAALNLINKWYKKDKTICILGALLNFSKKYRFTPVGINMGYFGKLSLGNIQGITLEDYGMTPDIKKALLYVKYAKEQLKNAETYIFYPLKSLEAIEGVCYRYGVGGYKKDLIQAAKRFNYAIDRYGDNDYSAMRELIESSSTLEDLYRNMIATSQNINGDKTHDMESLLRLAATEGPSKPVRYGYTNDFLFKVDKFVDSFWKLPVQERNVLYEASSEDVKTIYDNSLNYKIHHLYDFSQLNKDQIEELSLLIKSYPGEIAAQRARDELTAKKFLAESEGNANEEIEDMPEFPGGEDALRTFLSSTLKYPEIAADNGVQGRVIVSFIVEKDGSITSPQVTHSVDPALDKEAIRVVQSMPKWKPGKKAEQPVRVKHSIPINFRLQ